ncbi:undecaprenyl-phosphate glucose phosphotransferase [Thalassotalea atypica]|uniref:undecaprenyl-phosphate glucose phosphotransferase n=1 Tax=Thalassotalea atypica TaxID=2054316 RepID=UPI00257239BE|nr:undecaprenyl-phosphate glucose phosphotransferase [Thalassotalea atypica]
MSSGLLNTIQSSFSSLYRVIDLVVIGFTFFACLFWYQVPVTIHYQLVLLISLTCFLFFGQTVDLYRSWRTSTTLAMVSYAVLTWALSCVVLITLAYFTKLGVVYSRLAIGTWFVVTSFGLVIWRIFFRELLFYFRKSGANTRSVVIIGATSSGLKLAQQIQNNPQLGLTIEGVYDDREASRLPLELQNSKKGNIKDALALIKSKHEVNQVFVAMPLKAEERITEILSELRDSTATVHIVPDFLIYNLLHAKWQQIGNMETLSVYDSPFEGFNVTIKRVEDIVLSIVILSLILIPMFFIAILVKLTSKGPVLFKQKRYGLDGREIKIYKFRSMALVQKEVDKVKQATKFDARITPVGAFLRRTSLDELPQFFNVLQGSMSIVGPRPHAIVHNEEYRQLIDGYMLRHKVKPGITGWAQINGWRGETDTLEKMEKRIEFDLAYIHRWSLLFDLKIIVLTIFKGFVNKNAY